VNSTLASWNAARADRALTAMIACCGARRWADAMVALRPVADATELSEAADRIWRTMGEADWLEAFACHPRIGQPTAAPASPQSAAWSQEEQSSANCAAELVLAKLVVGNALYAQRFGFTYIVCATGKSAEEMLSILNRRLTCNRPTELREAAEQQRQIMQIRLRKWLIE
jgi:2-oxo-4-hydroxy-4-carboxy-5-ureidoimidazoline decarboxylase